MRRRRPDLSERTRRLDDMSEEEFDPIARDVWLAVVVVVVLNLVWAPAVGWLLLVLLGLWAGWRPGGVLGSWRARRR